MAGIKIPVGLDTSAFKRGIRDMKSDVQGFGTVATGAFNALSAAALAAFGFASTKLSQFVNTAVDDFRKFDTGLSRIQKLMDFGEPIGVIKDQIREMSLHTGRSLDELARAFEDVFSVDLGQHAKFVVDQAQQLALAIDIDLSTSVRLATSAMNAFGKEVQDLGQVMDIMSATIDVAAATGEEFSSAFGRMVGPTVAAKVELAEMNALWATLNVAGLEAGEAASGVSQLFLQLAKDSSQSGKIFQEATGTTFSQFVSDSGSARDAIVELMKHMREFDLTANDVFGSEARALTAFTILSENIAVLDRNLGALNDSLGETDRKAAIAASSVEFLNQKAENAIQRQFDEIGEETDEWLRKGQLGLLNVLDNVFEEGIAGLLKLPSDLISGQVWVDFFAGATQGVDELIDSLDLLKDELTDVERVALSADAVDEQVIHRLLRAARGVKAYDEAIANAVSEEEALAAALTKTNVLTEVGAATTDELIAVIGYLLTDLRENNTLWELYSDVLVDVAVETDQVVVSTDAADRKFIAMASSLNDAKNNVDRLTTSYRDMLRAFQEGGLLGPLPRAQSDGPFKISPETPTTEDPPFTITAEPTYGPDFIGPIPGGRTSTGVGTSGGSAAAVTPQPRITPSEVFSLAGQIGRDFVATGLPLTFDTINEYVRKRIADDVEFERETGYDRGFADLRVSDLFMGSYSDSPFRAIIEKPFLDLAAKNEATAEANRDALEKNTAQLIKDQQQRDAQARLEWVTATNERNRTERLSLGQNNRQTDMAQANRLFSLALGGMGPEALAAIANPGDLFRQSSAAFGFFGNNPETAKTFFGQIFTRWAKDYRDRQLAESIWGTADDTPPRSLDFGWSADTGSTARLFWGGVSGLANYVRERDCDFASEQRRTNELLAEGNEDRRRAKTVEVNVLNDPLAAGRSFVQSQRTASVVPGI